MVRCMLALVQELKASDLTKEFCQQEGISYTTTLHCREQLENYEELQDRIQGAASSSELCCILQKQGKGLQKLQHFLLRLHCLSSFHQTQENSCDGGHKALPPSSQQPGSARVGDDKKQRPPENGFGQPHVMVKEEVDKNGGGEELQDDKPSIKGCPIEVDKGSKYSCTKCDMSFRTTLLLRKHVHGHNGQRPFLCPHCPHQANRRDNLRSHCLLMHGLEIRGLPKEEVRNPKYVKAERKVITAVMEPVVIVKQEADNDASADLHHQREQEEDNTADTFDFAVPDMDNTNDSSTNSHSFINNNNNNTNSRLGYSSTEINSLSLSSQYSHSIFEPSSSISTNQNLERDQEDEEQMDIEQQRLFSGAQTTVPSPRSSPASQRAPHTSPSVPHTSQRGGDFVGTKSRRHYCDYCNYSSLEISLMRRHVVTKHRYEPRQQLFCPLCSFVTLQRTRYNEHMDREHTSDEGRYACNKCSYTSMHKSNLYRHLNTHMQQPRQLRCPLCPYMCVGNLSRHIRSRHSSSSGPHQCPDCTFRTWFVDKYQAHLNSHAGHDKFTCKACNWSTYYKLSFDQHLALYHRSNRGEEEEKLV